MPTAKPRKHADEVARIRKRHSSHLIRVTALTQPRSTTIADLDSIEDLIKLAKKYDSLVMEYQSAETTQYLLWDNGLLYRYHAAGDRTEKVPAAEALRRSSDS